jgi:hypothetical protein
VDQQSYRTVIKTGQLRSLLTGLQLGWLVVRNRSGTGSATDGGSGAPEEVGGKVHRFPRFRLPASIFENRPNPPTSPRIPPKSASKPELVTTDFLLPDQFLNPSREPYSCPHPSLSSLRREKPQVNTKYSILLYANLTLRWGYAKTSCYSLRHSKALLPGLICSNIDMTKHRNKVFLGQRDAIQNNKECTE